MKQPSSFLFVILLVTLATGCQSEKVDSTPDNQDSQVATPDSSRGGQAEPTGNTSNSSKEPMPVFVLPYYNPEGPEIQVDQHGSAIAEANSESILEISAELKKEIQILPAETMFVLSIRLYDLGHKDDAVYWFYSAQYRGKLFTGLKKNKATQLGLSEFELSKAFEAFEQTAGIHINGYAFGDLEKLKSSISQVLKENETTPLLNEIYPTVEFVPSEQWEPMRDSITKGLERILKHIEKNGDRIKAAREKSGIDERY